MQTNRQGEQMKKILSTTLIASIFATGAFANTNNFKELNKIIISKEIKVYSVPLKDSDNLKSIEKNGILQKEIKSEIDNADSYNTKGLICIYTTKNLSQKKKIKKIIKILEIAVKKSNLKNKNNIQQLIELLKNSIY